MKLVQNDEDKPSPVEEPKMMSQAPEKWARTERRSGI
jgi:hypothetical protein